MTVQLTRRRFTVDEYHWMARVGILGEDDRLELIDGEVIVMPPIGPEHSSALDDVAAVLFRALGDLARLRFQNPIQLSKYDAPEPDIAIVRQRIEGYKQSLPGPDDTYLLVEISDTTLLSDQKVKIPRYAQAGIREVWVLDLPHGLLHVYRDPTPNGYRTISTQRPGDRVAPLAFPERVISVSELIR